MPYANIIAPLLHTRSHTCLLVVVGGTSGGVPVALSMHLRRVLPPGRGAAGWLQGRVSKAVHPAFTPPGSGMEQLQAHGAHSGSVGSPLGQTLGHHSLQVRV